MLVELEFGNVGFWGGRKTADPREKPPEQDKNQQQTQLTHMKPGPNESAGKAVW